MRCVRPGRSLRIALPPVVNRLSDLRLSQVASLRMGATPHSARPPGRYGTAIAPALTRTSLTMSLFWKPT